MFKKLLRIRYVVLLAILTMFINAFFLIIGGTILSFKGYIEFIGNGFIPSETYKPGIYIMKGLDRRSEIKKWNSHVDGVAFFHPNL